MVCSRLKRFSLWKKPSLMLSPTERTWTGARRSSFLEVRGKSFSSRSTSSWRMWVIAGVRMPADSRIAVRPRSPLGLKYLELIVGRWAIETLDVPWLVITPVITLWNPNSVAIESELGNSGNTNCWKPNDGGWNAFLTSECVWMQMWVELHGADEKQDYMAFLDAYVESQKAIGRFPRPLNNRLNNVMEWMADQEVVADDVQVLLGLAILFLIVCLLNTIGLLLAKIMRRSGDISLRRALGASRNAIFSQYIIEAGVIGLCGGILGIGLTWLGLRGIEVLYRQYEFVENLVKMDWVMVLAAVALAIISALGAALYPTWRACRIHPAAQLKTL